MKGFKDHDLMKINPNDQQFEPTEAQPIRQHARMAGDPVPYHSGGPQRLSSRSTYKRATRGRRRTR